MEHAMEDTIFDKILRKEVPATFVFENDDVFAFKDINPTAPVHVLVVPKVRFRSLLEAGAQDPAMLGRYLQGVSATAHALGLDEGGYRVVFNNGPDAQQSVPYLHAHIIGGRRLSWPPG